MNHEQVEKHTIQFFRHAIYHTYIFNMVYEGHAGATAYCFYPGLHILFKDLEVLLHYDFLWKMKKNWTIISIGY